MIETQVWIPDPGQPGYLMYKRQRGVGEVYDDCRQALIEAGLFEQLDYFDIDPSLEPSAPWPRSRWTALFAVPGNSEGHYIHIEALDPFGGSDKHVLQILGKTFAGLDTALHVVGVLTHAFYTP